MSSPAHPTGSLLGIGAALPGDRVARGRARHCAARPDEDAITLAAEAGREALGADGAPAPGALILATTTPPYDEGGSVQVLSELLGLADDVFTTELSATVRDGLAALRLALALALTTGSAVLVCAAHAQAAPDAESGDGAVALLVGPPGADGALAGLAMGPSHVEELRDRWRLRGDDACRDGETSFVNDFGTTRLGSSVGRAATGGSGLGVAVAGLNARAAGKAESSLGGPGDDLVARTGILGAAHPLLRLACGLDAPRVVLAAAGGLVDAVTVTPGGGAAVRAAQRVRRRALGGSDRDGAVPPPSGESFDPYSSGPRAWRERGQDLRLEGIRYGERLVFPPPAAPPADDPEASGEVVALARTGTVLTQTRDHVYPGGDVTGMAVLDLDDGTRFYGQVVIGEQVDIGDRVRLVPRRLHQGGGVVQYFWKVAPWA